MKFYEILNEVLIKVNLTQNQTLKPFGSGSPEILELISLLNDLLRSFPVQEKITECLDVCNFRVYSPWTQGTEYKVGDCVSGMYLGKPVAYQVLSGGISNTEPNGGGIFSMNVSPNWIGGTLVQSTQEYINDKSAWRPVNTMVCGNVAPSGKQAEFVDDIGCVWVRIRDVLYWKNLGPEYCYPLDVIAPNCATIAPNTLYNKTTNRQLKEISAAQWQFNAAHNITAANAYYSIFNKAINLFPGFSQRDEISFMYYRKDLVQDAYGEIKDRFTEDDDELLYIPDQLFIWGAAELWLKMKGFDATFAGMRLHDELLPAYRARQQNTQRISLCGDGPAASMVPDGNWKIITD
ncbi:MAG: hypothetical protein LBJ18_03650 [Rickettsiales bacterium]|nr:hypothetical protein [Rickettsiales bacterium]